MVNGTTTYSWVTKSAYTCGKWTYKFIGSEILVTRVQHHVSHAPTRQEREVAVLELHAHVAQMTLLEGITLGVIEHPNTALSATGHIPAYRTACATNVASTTTDPAHSTAIVEQSIKAAFVRPFGGTITLHTALNLREQFPEFWQEHEH